MGQNFDTKSYKKSLESVGYRNVDTVYEHGEYTQRGAIFDIFPMGSSSPVRIELFDDEIESLRTFDPETQRSKNKLNELKILPAYEFPWDTQSRMTFRNQWLEQFPNATANSPLIRDIKEGIKPHGIEYYSPLFFSEMSSLFDYLPKDTLVLTPPETPELIDTLWTDINHRYEEHRYDLQRPILPPRNLFLKSDELFSSLKLFPRITLDPNPVEAAAGKENLEIDTLQNISIDDRASDPVSRLKTNLDGFDGRTLILAESAGRREVLVDLFKQYSLKYQQVSDWSSFLSKDHPVSLSVGGLSHGFISTTEAFQIITETELFGQRVIQSRRRKKATDNAELVVKNLTELRIGSPVVHIDNGVGRYRGLETLKVGDQVDEFLTLEYANEAKLYVPVASLHLISRYSGTDESLAPLHKLGTEKWSVAKQKAMEKIRDTAAELLEVYATREAQKGYKHDKPGEAYRSFCAGFPFEETPDQVNAINAVQQDMTREQPMDRLICGDVGFGKTEVAMRAAFIATHSGKQVAILVPTTLLAQQHYESFQDRFADTAIKVEVLSRFNTTKSQTQTLKNIAEGKADIIVGTHKLIQQDVKYKDLGLLIIDEEHRFGVQQKEKIKSFLSLIHF